MGHKIQKTFELVGAAEIIIGGLMTAYPQLLPQWVGLAVAAFGLVMLVAAFSGLIGGDKPLLLLRWRVRKSPTGWVFDLQDLWPLRRLVPLREAAQYAYDQIQDSTHIRLARNLSNGGTDLIAYAAQFFVKHIEIYGKRPPSSVRTRITGDLVNYGRLTDGGDRLVNGADVAIDVAVLRSQFYKALKAFKKNIAAMEAGL